MNIPSAPNFIALLESSCELLAPKLASLTIFKQRIMEKPHLKKQILYQHCQFTSFKVALLVNRDYANKIIKYRTSRTELIDLLTHMIKEDNVLFTINCFPKGSSGHSFSYIKYDGKFYLIDSWHCQRDVTVEENNSDEVVEYILDYSQNGLYLSWDYCPIVVSKIEDNFMNYLRLPEPDL
jgi:hypothetical protein